MHLKLKTQSKLVSLLQGNYEATVTTLKIDVKIQKARKSSKRRTTYFENSKQGGVGGGGGGSKEKKSEK